MLSTRAIICEHRTPIKSIKSYVLLIIIAVVSSACATVRPDFETPTVTVSSFKALPSEGIAPRFQIGLHIVNPNRTPLKLQGVAYSISLEGHKIITGVANDLPQIAAYGEGQVVVTAVTDVLNTIRLVAGLMKQPQHQFDYEFNAKLDIGALLPVIRVVDRGSVSLDPEASSQQQST